MGAFRSFSTHNCDKFHPIPIAKDEDKEIAWGVPAAGSKHEPMWIPRGKVGDQHIKFEIMFSGICQSDCAYGNDKFGATKYPMVAGHEMLGKISEVGKEVKDFKVGDIVGCGVIVDSCQECEQCLLGDEQYCEKAPTRTYNGIRSHGGVPGNKDLPTYGGYAASSVVHQKFLVKIPEGLPLEAAGPIMCAGTTMYDPLKHYGCVGGDKKTIGFVGIGGLGSIGVKIAKALGHDVVAISNTHEQEQMAMDRGATHFVVSSDEKQMKELASSCHLIINTVGAPHQVQTYF